MSVDLKPKRPYWVMALAFVLCFALLAVQLGNLQLMQGDAFAKESENRRLRTFSVSGARGSITDVNGVVLAYDERSYLVQFYRDSRHNKKSD
ncbi:MAG: hypothetical protein II781_04180, partial [Clostridia bacterium]|nr:hypothetical protein [Clostridia bacterium]